MTRLVLTGGGTGGHIYPALAIAGGVKRRWPQTEILYIGAKGGMESHIVAEAGYPFRGVTAAGWQGRKITNLAGALIADHKGWREAAALLAVLKPKAVVGTGGYVCLPVALAAVQKHIPLYIHEQNAYPGITNRLISAQAKRVMVSFEEAAEHFPTFIRKKIMVTGLPVRESIATADRAEALAFYGLREDRRTVLVAGGSQGAERINRAMIDVIKDIYVRDDVQILYSTGRRDYQQIADELKRSGIVWETGGADSSNIRMLPYIDRMDLAYAAAHVYVGRAGASTMAEITLNHLPAVLVPYPYASENHQAFNAASLADKGGAVVLEDQELSGQTLLKALVDLLDDEPRRITMAERSSQAAYGRALDNILDVLAEIMD
ncbi:MAG: undecaprenyldiphospho-muramoylpentapeptide beta-N-acetylglucosaminyltransferase [Peptococcaceae bacterium]|jgi:UDP-N-acetylglucosamine--N-acetylmuramyl-(pentapeptide) pyrophosphoryl-undecaprenol N-acetylglucosamine transferase|nr:undecaprenyldiphospho-muramoylpentapeptide beta-N-acetylglucosaminyltransferase [Peptococcaceae bacterium]